VVEEISRELPNLSTFVTLSPAPMFMEWLADERRDQESRVISHSDRLVLEYLDEPGWHQGPVKVAALKPVLGALAAHYFLNMRTDQGRQVDPVARFHLGNGARLERINLMADLSEKALAQSAGIMVNYRYVLADIEKNHEAYAEAGEVVASSAVRHMLRSEKASRALVSQS
jgi:malonyl-CoA decarboxylase